MSPALNAQEGSNSKTKACTATFDVGKIDHNFQFSDASASHDRGISLKSLVLGA